MAEVQEIDLGVLLGLPYEPSVADLHRAPARRGFEHVGKTYGYVFRAVDDGALSITELAGRLGITTQGVTKLVNEMEGAGFVERIDDPDDARMKRVRLTAAGRGVLWAARRFHGSFERALIVEHGERSV